MTCLKNTEETEPHLPQAHSISQFFSISKICGLAIVFVHGTVLCEPRTHRSARCRVLACSAQKTRTLPVEELHHCSAFCGSHAVPHPVQAYALYRRIRVQKWVECWVRAGWSTPSGGWTTTAQDGPRAVSVRLAPISAAIPRGHHACIFMIYDNYNFSRVRKYAYPFSLHLLLNAN